MSELIELLKNNIGVNSHARVPSDNIHLSGDDFKRAMELIKEIESKEQ